MDQPAEPVATAEAKAGLGRARRQWSQWCCMLQGAVGALLVDMRRVLGQDVFEVAPVENQYSVEQLAGHCCIEATGALVTALSSKAGSTGPVENHDNRASMPAGGFLGGR